MSKQAFPEIRLEESWYTILTKFSMSKQAFPEIRLEES